MVANDMCNPFLTLESSMNNGIFHIMIHGWSCFYKFDDGVFYYPDLSKGKYVWQRTIIDPDRASKMLWLQDSNVRDLFEAERLHAVNRIGSIK